MRFFLFSVVPVPQKAGSTENKKIFNLCDLYGSAVNKKQLDRVKD
jgi:hypothetical protein